MLQRSAPPDAVHWFGTDQSGRDVFSRVIWGGRASFEVSALAVVIGCFGGVVLGLIAGFFSGGWLEQAVMRVLDAMASIPLLIWAIALVGILGVSPVHIGGLAFGNEVKLLCLLGLLYIPTLARITYTSARTRPAPTMSPRAVCKASAVCGSCGPTCCPTASRRSSCRRRCCWLSASSSRPRSVLSASACNRRVPSWGNMLADARNYLFSGEWWLSVFPGAAISLSVIAINLLGDGLRDVSIPAHSTSALAA